MKALDKVKANLKLHLMAGIDGFKEVSIPEIPSEWEKFPGSNDEWIKIPMPNSENSSSCLYKAVSKSFFKPHKHDGIKEHFTVMNEGGSLRVITENEIKIINYPDSYVVPAGELHACEFITDTVIMIVWHPMFKKGWDASFKQEKENGIN